MTNHRAVIDLIKAVSGQANILTIPRSFVDFVGSLDGGLLLSQIIYWSDKTKDPQGWFYKTYADWQVEICLSEYEVRKNVKRLAQMGFLETKVKKAPNGNPTVHYRLDWNIFSETFLKFLQERSCKNSSNESEDSRETLNTEITTKTTHKEREADIAPLNVAKVSNSKKSQEPLHPAIEAYKQSMGRYPAKGHWPDIIAAVGVDGADLLFWEQVVRGWKLTGWNPQNTGGMLDYYRRREIPTTSPTKQPGRRYLNGHTTTQSQSEYTGASKAGGQARTQTDEGTDRGLLKAHLERKSR